MGFLSKLVFMWRNLKTKSITTQVYPSFKQRSHFSQRAITGHLTMIHEINYSQVSALRTSNVRSNPLSGRTYGQLWTFFSVIM